MDGSKKKIILGIVVFLLIASLTFITIKKYRYPPQKRFQDKEILIIGIDGFNWHVLGPLLKEGRMPNIRKLMKNGVYGAADIDIDDEHLWSPAIWTSMLTGKTMDKHKINSLYCIYKGKLLTFPMSTMRREPALWNILTRHRIPSSFVSFLATWPVEKIYGSMISCFAIPWAFIKNADYLGREDFFKKYGNPRWLTYPYELMDKVYSYIPPAEEIDEMMKRYGIPLSIPRERGMQEKEGHTVITEHLREKFLDSVHTDVDLSEMEIIGILFLSGQVPRMMFIMDYISTQLAVDFIRKKDTVVDAVYIGGVDIFSHFFWPQSKNPARDMTETMRNYYLYIDDLVGQLLEDAGEDTLVFVMSDHGYRYDFESKVTRHDQEKAVFIISGERVKNIGEIENVGILDYVPTILYYLGIEAEGMAGKILKNIFFSLPSRQ
ncbi:MAG: hypothetical protein GF375_05695 [Candidatus Omnitrophica bacterium]|nr:hypothetical protein [Candidatus Omnitrophota bacterium]MBD3269476.1 hypothetical protein [Candidatus Omnitrophota bacterium]